MGPTPGGEMSAFPSYDFSPLYHLIVDLFVLRRPRGEFHERADARRQAPGVREEAAREPTVENGEQQQQHHERPDGGGQQQGQRPHIHHGQYQVVFQRERDGVVEQRQQQQQQHVQLQQRHEQGQLAAAGEGEEGEGEGEEGQGEGREQY